MIGKARYRSIRPHFKSIVIWAMVPMAAISGRSVSGCLSPSGHFDPNCQCTAIDGQAGSNASACHCSCCADRTCCCKSRALAKDGTKGSGLQDSSRCRAVGFYAVTTAVNASKSSVSFGDDHQSAQLAVLPAEMPSSLAKIRGECVAELNTGPPPERLIVTLHHWVI
jgi:hypothetical protein